MGKKSTKRLGLYALLTLGVGLGLFIILSTFEENIVFYQTPTQVLLEKPRGKIRLGGLVQQGTLRGSREGTSFMVIDQEKSVPVLYNGLPPALFQEGKGVVAEGYLEGDTFYASLLLAKHDETYRAPH